MTNDRVLVYYLSPGVVEHEFCQSLLELSIYDLMTSQHLAGVFGVRSGALLASARNTVVEQFLDNDVADWLLFIDSDMTFERDALEHLFKHADPETCPIIGGLCYGLDFVEGPFPVVYSLVETPDGPMTTRPSVLEQDTGLLSVDATGAAFLMIHRSVLTAIQDRGFSKAYPWFQETELGNGYPVGEDIAFCLRARTLGYPIVVNLDLRIGHKKDQIVIGAAPTTATAAASAPLGASDEIAEAEGVMTAWQAARTRLQEIVDPALPDFTVLDHVPSNGAPPLAIVDQPAPPYVDFEGATFGGRNLYLELVIAVARGTNDVVTAAVDAALEAALDAIEDSDDFEPTQAEAGPVSINGQIYPGGVIRCRTEVRRRGEG